MPVRTSALGFCSRRSEKVFSEICELLSNGCTWLLPKATRMERWLCWILKDNSSRRSKCSQKARHLLGEMPAPAVAFQARASSLTRAAGARPPSTVEGLVRPSTGKCTRKPAKRQSDGDGSFGDEHEAAGRRRGRGMRRRAWGQRGGGADAPRALALGQA